MMNIKSIALIIGTLTTPYLLAQTLPDLTFGPQKETPGKILDNVVAVVGNDIITRQELQRAGGKNHNATLERLIIQKLLSQAAKQRNIVIGDTALNIALDQQKRNGRKLTRETLRQQLLIQKLQQQVANSLVTVSDQEIAAIVDQQLKGVDESVRLVDILIRVPESADSDILQQAQAKTQRILARLKSQPGEVVARDYDDVTYNDLGWVPLADIPTTFSKALIGAATNEYLTPIIDRDGIHILKVLARKSAKPTATSAGVPETQVSHILIRDKGNPRAKSTIDALYQRLKNGEDFAELAKQHSQDVGSAINGGSLDWAVPGQMVPDFEAVMNNTAVGDISKPFKTPFGYHILTVHERRQATKNSREALEQQARQAIFLKKASEEWDLWLSRLRDESYVDIRL